ncbi:unnamed protein product, partial [Pleuronectes platessa]
EVYLAGPRRERQRAGGLSRPRGALHGCREVVTRQSSPSGGKEINDKWQLWVLRGSRQMAVTPELTDTGEYSGPKIVPELSVLSCCNDGGNVWSRSFRFATGTLSAALF